MSNCPIEASRAIEAWRRPGRRPSDGHLIRIQNNSIGTLANELSHREYKLPGSPRAGRRTGLHYREKKTHSRRRRHCHPLARHCPAAASDAAAVPPQGTATAAAATRGRPVGRNCLDVTRGRVTRGPRQSSFPSPLPHSCFIYSASSSAQHFAHRPFHPRPLVSCFNLGTMHDTHRWLCTSLSFIVPSTSLLPSLHPCLPTFLPASRPSSLPPGSIAREGPRVVHLPSLRRGSAQHKGHNDIRPPSSLPPSALPPIPSLSPRSFFHPS